MREVFYKWIEDVFHKLSVESEDFHQLYNHKLYHTVDDRLKTAVNTCADLLDDRVMGWTDMLWDHIIDKEDIERAIMTAYFTVVALDTIVDTGKKRNHAFKTKTYGNYYLQEVGIWNFKNLFISKPLYLCLMNREDNSKIDLNIGLDPKSRGGWLNWKMRVDLIDEDRGKTYPCDFINGLEDLKFDNIQKALNYIKD